MAHRMTDRQKSGGDPMRRGSSRGASPSATLATCARSLRFRPTQSLPSLHTPLQGNPPLRHPAAKQDDREPLRLLSSCHLCPRECGVDRLAGERGFCGAGAVARVAAVSVHHGEEPPISGKGGSGTVFLSHCNMACRFCQNYPISQLWNGREMDAEALADEL